MLRKVSAALVALCVAAVGLVLTPGTAGAAAGGPYSDGFAGPSLAPMWTPVNLSGLSGEASLSFAGGSAVISIPAGDNHDIYSGINNAPRLQQSVSDVGFAIEAKFGSTPAEGVQIEGIYLEGSNEGHWARIVSYFDGALAHVEMSVFDGATVTQVGRDPISTGLPLWLKVVRTGNTYTVSYSQDGITYTPLLPDLGGTNYVLDLVMSKVAVYAANSDNPLNSPAPAPAFTATIDHFFTDLAPVISGVAVTPTSNSATVTWNTTAPSTSQVDHGLTGALGTTTNGAANATAHSVTLTGLACATTYSYRVTSVDASPDTNSSSSSIATFTTGSCQQATLTGPAIGVATAPSGGGYWLVATNGSVANFGGANFFGSMGGQPLNKPIVGIAATPTGNGYWLVASDGGIFAFGDAAFFGSTGAITLNKPIVGMASTPSGNGYWLVASDGGIFAYGDAAFFGSTGAITLNKPIVGMDTTPTGAGYWLVASDGGIFAFGNATFLGSTGAIVLNKPIVGMAASPSGNGYWFVATDGGIFNYGDAGFYGSAAGQALTQPIAGIAPLPSGTGYRLVDTGATVYSFGS